jgi:hypothetical protein
LISFEVPVAFPFPSGVKTPDSTQQTKEELSSNGAVSYNVCVG